MLQIQNFKNTFLLAVPCVALLSLTCGCRQTGSNSFRAPFSSLSKSDDGPSAAAVDLRLAMAQSHELSGDAEEAIAAYEQLANENNIPQAMHRLGVLHDKQGNFKKASEYYRKALKHRPDDADLLCDLGYSFYLQENFKASESHLRRAVAIDPKMERAHNNLGLLFARTNQQDAALAAFRSAAKNDDVALANFNSVMTDKEQSSSACVADDTHAPPVPMVHVQPTPLKRKSISAKQVNLSSPPATIGLPQHINYELPPAHPSLIASEEVQIEPVKLADFSQTQSTSGSIKIESGDHAAPSLNRPAAVNHQLVDPVKVEIPPHWSKFFPEL